MDKYDDLDAHITRILSAGPMTWIQVHERARAACPGAYSIKADKDWRLTDRRLQALRKAGRIRNDRRGRSVLWSLQ